MLSTDGNAVYSDLSGLIGADLNIPKFLPNSENVDAIDGIKDALSGKKDKKIVYII